MHRIITFGCSFTYGSELPDCVGQPKLNSLSQIWDRKPSQYAWPAVLGKLMNMDVCNQSHPGASNLEILCEVLDFKFRPDDIVVIMWSLSHRELIFEEVNSKSYKRKFGEKGLRPWRKLTVWSKGVMAEDFQKVKEIDYIKRTWIYMHHADLYLKSKKLKYIHYPAAPYEIQELKPDFIEAPDNLYWTRTQKIDAAADDRHPGIESHKLQAEEIKRVLEEVETKRIAKKVKKLKELQ